MIIVRPMYPEFVPMGMYKNGTSSVPNGSVDYVVQNWLPQSAYPNTEILGHKMVVNGAGDVIINVKIEYVFGPGMVHKFMKNNEVLHSETLPNGFTYSKSITTSVVPGDLIYMTATGSTGGFPHSITANNSSSTVITVVAA